jgi:hypothetical protein
MVGAVIMFGLLDVLRIPRAIELEGLDFEEIELWRPLNLM